MPFFLIATMNLIRKWIESDEYKWLWFGGIFIGSAIPMILRGVLSLDRNIDSFDIKDLLFMGLAVNLSNLNLIGSREFKYKVSIAFFSVLFILMMGFGLGEIMTDESNRVKGSLMGLTVVSVIFVTVSVYVSYEANRYVFAVVDQK
jgi:hypothetical protein